MDWSKGYSASYYMTRVDPATWRDVERIEITGGSVKRSTSGLMQSADVYCTGWGYNGESYIRLYLDTAQRGQHSHVPLFTGLATSPDKDMKGRLVQNTLTCYSVLKPCDDVVLARGWYASEGMPGGLILKQLLTATPAPVTIADGSPELAGTIVAEDGETNLTMIWRVLDAIGWRLRITGDGAISAEPKPTEPVTVFDPLSADVIETEIKVSEDWYSCPNVLLCICDDVTATARDDSELSPLSTIRRGREVWAVESDCDLGTNESIAGYSARRLRELQQVQKTAEYDRRFVPGVLPGDLVLMHYPEQGLEGVFNVDSQSVELGHAARTAEKLSTFITMEDFAEREAEIGLARLITDDGEYLISDDDEQLVALTEY